MDSGGNSGSLQSSSGGDEEYDSRAADSFFITSHTGAGAGVPIPPQLFDPFTNYSSILNPNTAWPGPVSLRSDPNLNPGTPQEFNSSTLLSSPGSLVFQPPATAENGGVPVGQNLNQATAPPPPRNPRKRSRASRRAPTTVLTTDTTNFRAMVQEFTGIPAPPFNTSSFPRTRLDLFGGRSVALDPPYLRRPFAQKVQSPPPFPAGTPNLFNFPNPLLLQSTPKFKPNPPVLDEFNLSAGDRIIGLPNLISTDQIEANKNTDHIDEAGSHFHQAEAINGGEYTSTGKASENGGGRSEGMVESWICSSSE